MPCRKAICIYIPCFTVFHFLVFNYSEHSHNRIFISKLLCPLAAYSSLKFRNITGLWFIMSNRSGWQGSSSPSIYFWKIWVHVGRLPVYVIMCFPVLPGILFQFHYSRSVKLISYPGPDPDHGTPCRTGPSQGIGWLWHQWWHLQLPPSTCSGSSRAPAPAWCM